MIHHHIQALQVYTDVREGHIAAKWEGLQALLYARRAGLSGEALGAFFAFNNEMQRISERHFTELKIARIELANGVTRVEVVTTANGQQTTAFYYRLGAI